MLSCQKIKIHWSPVKAKGLKRHDRIIVCERSKVIGPLACLSHLLGVWLQVVPKLSMLNLNSGKLWFFHFNKVRLLHFEQEGSVESVSEAEVTHSWSYGSNWLCDCEQVFFNIPRVSLCLLLQLKQVQFHQTIDHITCILKTFEQWHVACVSWESRWIVKCSHGWCLFFWFCNLFYHLSNLIKNTLMSKTSKLTWLEHWQTLKKNYVRKRL